MVAWGEVGEPTVAPDRWQSNRFTPPDFGGKAAKIGWGEFLGLEEPCNGRFLRDAKFMSRNNLNAARSLL